MKLYTGYFYLYVYTYNVETYINKLNIKTMKTLKTTARILFGLPFIVFGINHFLNAGMMAGYVLAKWPAAVVLVYISGAGMLLAGVSFVINKYVKLAGLLLAAELAIFVLAIQLPGLFNPQTMQMSMIGFLKDFSLMSAALLIAATSEEVK